MIAQEANQNPCFTAKSCPEGLAASGVVVHGKPLHPHHKIQQKSAKEHLDKPDAF